jgi:hypothetical protein
MTCAVIGELLPPRQILSAPKSPLLAHRLLLTIAIAELSGGFAWFVRTARPDLAGSDLTPILDGVRAVVAGLDPYTADPGQPLIYPFPALVLLWPLAWVPSVVVDAAWVGLSAGLLAFALTRERLWSPALLLLVSPAMLHAIQTSQWSPLLLALMLLGRGSGFAYACKPSTALWLFAYRPTRRAVAEGSALLIVSLILWPEWPAAWLGGLQDARWSLSLVTAWGGPLLLVVLLKWRRPEARMLATMACVPHTPLLYETLPLGLIPQTWTQGGILWAGMLIARVGQAWTESYEGPVFAAWLIWCVYLPAVGMILLRKNEASVTDVPHSRAGVARVPSGAARHGTL